MLVIFAVIIGGIATGRLLIGRRLAFVPRLITVIIWAPVGSCWGSRWLRSCGRGLAGDARRGGAGDLRPLRRGSIFAAWLLWRRIRGRAVPADDGEAAADVPVSAWAALCGSLVIVAFFAAGCVRTFRAVRYRRIAGQRLCALCADVLRGDHVGQRPHAGRTGRRLDPRLALLPVATAVGTLAGAALAAPLLAEWSLTDSLAVGAGFGYYSLSSIFIADFQGPELATIALLCNVMREIFTLLAAPLVARWCGPLAAVSIGGATTFDTTLPIITQAAGRPYAVVSVFHGCVLDFSVPFLVTFFCTV